MPCQLPPRWLAVLLALFLYGLTAQAAHAQAVHLPTFKMFTVRTTVVAPDSGAAQAGSLRRSIAARNGRGLPLAGTVPGVGRVGRNEALGVERQAGGMQVRANIMRFDELEDALLEQAAVRNAGRPVDSRDPLAPIFRAGPVASVRAIRNGAPAAPPQDDQASDLLARGQQAVEQGKPNVARIYFRMAAEQGSGELQQQAQEELAALNTAMDDRIARRAP